MYVTQSQVRLQKHEVEPIVNFLFRGIAFLSTPSKLSMFVRLFLTFVVQRRTMNGKQWNSAVAWTRGIDHHEISLPELKNAKGLYFRKLYTKKDPDAHREWNELIDVAVQDSIVSEWGGGMQSRVNAMLTKIRDVSNLSVSEYNEIVDYFDELGYSKDTLPEWGNCEIISFPNLESA